MAVTLKALIGKCNRETRTALEAAAGLCLSRTHYDVEIEHYLMKLLDQADSDCSAILKQIRKPAQGADPQTWIQEVQEVSKGSARICRPRRHGFQLIEHAILGEPVPCSVAPEHAIIY